MSETPAETNYHPSIVGNAFMRQYYQLLAKEPQSLHRFYKDESLWSHTTGSQMQEPIAGQKAINEQILKRAYAGARVDLDIGSIDCQESLCGGVFVLVTGVMTLVDSVVPKPFVQTFFLATQPNGYFVLNDCLRFLELPGVSPASLVTAEPGAAVASASAAEATAAATASPPTTAATKDTAKKPQAAIGTPVTQSPASKTAKPQVSPAKTASPDPTPAAAALTSVAKKEAAPALSVAKASPTAAAHASPSKTKARVESPAKTEAPKSAPRDASPVERTASDTGARKPAAASSPAIASPKASSAPAATALSPAAPAAVSPPAVAATAPVSAPAAPPAPTSWASLLFSATSSAPVSTGPVKLAPVLSSVVGAAASTAKATSAVVASPKLGSKAAADVSATAPKEKTRYYSLFIKDVPSQTKDTDLRELFKSYGAIAGVNVVAQRGYAFVDYYEQESMRAALAETASFTLFDKALLVEERTDRKDQRGSFRGETTRGGRGGGRGGAGPKSRVGSDRKEPDETKERRTGGESGSNANANGGSNAGRGGGAPRSDRREKGGRRVGKVDGGARAE